MCVCVCITLLTLLTLLTYINLLNVQYIYIYKASRGDGRGLRFTYTQNHTHRHRHTHTHTHTHTPPSANTSPVRHTPPYPRHSCLLPYFRRSLRGPRVRGPRANSGARRQWQLRVALREMTCVKVSKETYYRAKETHYVWTFERVPPSHANKVRIPAEGVE